MKKSRLIAIIIMLAVMVFATGITSVSAAPDWEARQERWQQVVEARQAKLERQIAKKEEVIAHRNAIIQRFADRMASRP